MRKVTGAVIIIGFFNETLCTNVAQGTALDFLYTTGFGMANLTILLWLCPFVISFIAHLHHIINVYLIYLLFGHSHIC